MVTLLLRTLLVMGICISRGRLVQQQLMGMHTSRPRFSDLHVVKSLLNFGWVRILTATMQECLILEMAETIILPFT